MAAKTYKYPITVDGEVLPGNLYHMGSNELIWFCMGWNARLEAADDFAKGVAEATGTTVYTSLLRPTQIWHYLEPHQDNILVDHLGLILGRGTSGSNLEYDMVSVHEQLRDIGRVGHYIGHSQSSGLGALALSEFELRGMTLLAPYPSFGHTMVKEPCEGTDKQRFLDRIPWGPLNYKLIEAEVDKPIRFVIAGNDRVLHMHKKGTREHCMQLLKDRFPQAEIEIVENVNHNFNPGRRLNAFNRDNEAGLVEIVSEHYLTCASNE